ncbi:ATP-binding protein [Streptacidiphilus sp. PB12-B1b]|uniref:ATP-binding protein n=1 Tax=Streptacidiphilus sp. PB12-B1b TaxID=2705012 RepID=UPI0015FD0215|nr:ATP-binding protein [Streptacidiphilus sp. PB12-B1b]QMU77196.1 ATP-binding protein [Streptacidiphilus sp. PB12-B1b]
MSNHQEAMPSHATFVLDGLSGTTKAARGLAAAFLRGPPAAVPEEAAADALLLVSELVANAVHHAPGPCVLELVDDGADLVVAVSDTSDALPQRRAPDLKAGGGGFGWNLLTSLSARVAVIGHPAGGKTVTAILRWPYGAGLQT